MTEDTAVGSATNRNVPHRSGRRERRILWGTPPRKGPSALALAGLAVLLPVTAHTAVPAPAAAPRTGSSASVLVSLQPGAAPAARQVEQVVLRSGGRVERRMAALSALEVRVPAAALADLRRIPGVRAVAANQPVGLTGNLPGSAYDQAKQAGSLQNVAKQVKADKYWRTGITGKGVDVAVVDSGVAPVAGLKLAPGIDLTGAGSTVDAFGHGTHMAGIIGGRTSTKAPGSGDQFYGIAPDARIVPVRVANAQGTTDTATIMAGIDWVISNKSTDGRNIRVLELALATKPLGSFLDDPLAAAVESAWKAGIVVVVASGNSGAGSVLSPAYDPHVIAVGAQDSMGTIGVNDDMVAAFSSSPVDQGQRHPDLVAPGVSVQSFRVKGSTIDKAFSGSGAINDQYFKGSGTSQASAVVAGAAALLLQQVPSLSPDDVKGLFTTFARPLRRVSDLQQGEGGIRLDKVLKALTGLNVEDDENVDGLSDPISTFDASGDDSDLWSAGFGPNTPLLTGNTWTGNTWTGNTWTGNTWTGNTWTGNTWTGNTWTGSTWTGNTWTGNTWTGNVWSSVSWR